LTIGDSLYKGIRVLVSFAGKLTDREKDVDEVISSQEDA